MVLNSTPDFWLHYSFVNMDSKKLFPYPKWRIVVYLEEPVPPCFYIYYKNTAIAASMIDGSIQGSELPPPSVARWGLLASSTQLAHSVTTTGGGQISTSVHSRRSNGIIIVVPKV